MVSLRRVVEVAVVLEGLLLLGGGAYLVVGLATGPATEPWAAAFMALMALVMAGFLGLAVRGLHHARPWVRGPLLVWQVLQVTAVWPSAGEVPWLVAGVVAVSLIVGIGVLLPGVVEPREGGLG